MATSVPGAPSREPVAAVGAQTLSGGSPSRRLLARACRRGGGDQELRAAYLSVAGAAREPLNPPSRALLWHVSRSADRGGTMRRPCAGSWVTPGRSSSRLHWGNGEAWTKRRGVLQEVRGAFGVLVVLAETQAVCARM